VPAYRCHFYYGPCDEQVKQLFFAGVPDATVKCGGQTYRKEPTTEAGTIAYVLDSADVLYRPEPIPGQRDMWRAWSRLHGALNATTRRQLLRTRAASGRIRRAVR
jgi:hypothetical protein